MAKRIEKERMNSYTQQQRQALKKELNKVLDRCTDQRFGKAISAAAREIRGGK